LSQVLAIAAGGALGALTRYWVALAVHGLLGRGFPYGTLAVNVLGSAFIGLLSVLFMERLALAPEWRAAVLIGFLGAFTTFSTFSYETLALVEAGAVFRAGLNVAANVLLCLGAAWAGTVAGRML
jgi:CrcB protein